jgi:hypothetical protein
MVTALPNEILGHGGQEEIPAFFFDAWHEMPGQKIRSDLSAKRIGGIGE